LISEINGGQKQALFISGLTLYEARLDKSYSLTDCVSMVVMQQEEIQEVLTHDKHFAQEGFTILL
jgi:predicted nucleic acid-binding protein